MSNNKERKVALVTGATGFVGSHLTRRLVNEGWDVHTIIRPQSSLDSIQDIIENLTVHKHCGTTERMHDIVAEAKPVVVFHLASLFLAQHQARDIEPLIKSNILFGTQLLEAMVTNRVYRLINTGTSWQHYNDEDYNPACLYAATKQAFETILKFYLETTPLKAITLKLFDTYGPDDQRPKLFNLLKKATEEHKPLVMSPGEQLISVVYIDDVVNAFILSAERLLTNEGRQYEDYAVSYEKPMKLKDLVEIYQKVTGKSLTIEWGGRSYRPREVMVPWRKGKLLPGWTPKICLEDGIKRLSKPLISK